ncbi:Cytochrome c-type biogenesis protein CcmC, putative heme lyase for CcmE [hydrothermal vent metagenome]|uniref:Cytochrome c-type biogenesis protein CcmC, putative heme lyase for CcmE n=1 Tax=hydrothermal vent metagenome TaxID=652676 RepID=A0A3B0X9P6_9ZZZZ
MKLPAIIHKFSSPKNFYTMSGKMIPWFVWSFFLTLLFGLYYGFFVAPTDYQQGESYRIMFIHVPAAWMSMFIYMIMAVSGGIGLIWRIKTADLMASVSAPIGAAFTLLALVTGSLWGKPMWGTYWVWDARLTSELILLFLYLGFIALQASIEDPRNAARAGAILAIVGVVNIPIIHYSVEWWSTLHQGATVSKMDKPSMHIDMLIPLLVMAVSFKLYYGASVLMRARGEILRREQNTRWVKEVIENER